MRPLLRKSGNQHLHRATPNYRDQVKRTRHAYHVFIQASIVCQGLFQYLAVASPRIIWNALGSWLHTIPLGIPPSGLVVATALRQHLPEFPLNCANSNIFANFIAERRDTDKMQPFGLAA